MINVRSIIFSLILVPIATAAMAHPHVWITMSQVVMFTPDGQISGIQHRWVFDEAYSAFAVQGVPRDQNGKIGADVLAPLAKTNTQDLAEFNYFTHCKKRWQSNGIRRADTVHI